MSRIAIAAAVLLTFAAYPSFAQEKAQVPGQVLKGTIRVRSGGAVSTCVILLQHYGSNERERLIPQPPIVVRPDYKGQFAVSLAPNIYDVFVSCPLHYPEAKQVEIHEGRDVVLNVKLRFTPIAL